MTWEQYKVEFGKMFSSPREESYRRAIFEQNKKSLEADDCTACGVTKFSDQTQA